MPPMPRIPRTFPCGSWPSGGGGEPFQWPFRRAIIAVSVSIASSKWAGGGNLHVLNPRNAPRIKNMLTSAVASSTAVGTLETRISCVVQAWTSI